MECFDVLDESGNKTGKVKPRNEVHKDGDWHKAVHVLIVNDLGEILLQRRSANKEKYPNMWHMSSAGHVISGERSIDTAIKETEEELGIIIKEKDLELIDSAKSSKKPKEDFIENEFQDIFLVRMNVDIENVTIQKEEVSEVKFIPYLELEKIIEAEDKNYVPVSDYKVLLQILKERMH